MNNSCGNTLDSKACEHSILGFVVLVGSIKQSLALFYQLDNIQLTSMIITGMQPTFRQVPPSFPLDSTQATF